MAAPSKKKKSVPNDINQWAADAFDALEKAVIAFEEDYPEPDEDERLELIGYAAEIAAEARGITDASRIDEADEYAVDNVLADLDEDDESEEEAAEPQYALLFLLCYLDAHVSFGLLQENKLQAIIEFLVANYDLAID